MSAQSKPERRWYSRWRWAILLAFGGILIIVFVLVTGGEIAAWMLWFAVPMLMISLGYIFLANAIPIFLAFGEEKESDENPGDGSRQR